MKDDISLLQNGLHWASSAERELDSAVDTYVLGGLEMVFKRCVVPRYLFWTRDGV